VAVRQSFFFAFQCSAASATMALPLVFSVAQRTLELLIQRVDKNAVLFRELQLKLLPTATFILIFFITSNERQYVVFAKLSS
jgi:hypothetical protein